MVIFTSSMMAAYNLTFCTHEQVLAEIFAEPSELSSTGKFIASCYDRILPPGHSMIPVPLDSIHPWSDDPELQPFRAFVGANKYPVDFKNAWFWFLDCIAVSDDSDPNIAEWQKHVQMLRFFNFFGSDVYNIG